MRSSEHLGYQLVDVLFSISPISLSLEGMSLGSESSSWSSKFEWPEEVVSFFEVGSNCMDFVNKILNVIDVVLMKRVIDDFIVRKRNSLLVHLSVSSLQDQFSDGLA